MKKIDILRNNKAVYVIPPEPIDENEEICIVDYLLLNPKGRQCVMEQFKELILSEKLI